MAWNMTEDQFVRDMTNFSCENRKLQERALVENKHVFNILAKLKEFREQEKLCDLVCQVKKTKFPVHKAVVAAWSPKIANLILSQSDVKADTELYVNYDNESAFSDFLEYCYSGLIIPTERSVYALLDIGRNFMVETLVNMCEDFLKSNISLLNYVSRFITSVKYSLSSLEETIISFIESNLSNVIEQNELLTLSLQDLDVFLSSGKMGQLKQEVKMSLIVSWVGVSPLERNKFLLYLLSQITWDHSVGDLLIQISCTENLFTANEFCLFQLLQCVVNGTGHHLGPFMTTYPHLYSLYSHMLEELLHPKVLATSSSKIEDIVNIPVSIHPCNGPLVETRDAEVNTDVDGTYFDKTSSAFLAPQALAPAETLEAVENTADIGDISPVVLIESDKDNEIPNSIEDTSPTVAVEEVYSESCKVDQTGLNIKHRRKGRPRKISATSSKDAKDTKEKRGRGRPKKNHVKLEEAREVKIEVVVSPLESGNGKDINEDTGNVNIDEKPVEGMNTIVEEIVGNGSVYDDVNDNGDKICVLEEKPRIKLNLKLKQLKSVKSKARRKKGIQINTNLSSHVQKTDQMFKCSYENCSYSTKNEFRLDKHVECVHNVDVRLECKQCEFSTNQMRELCIHMKTHYTKLPYYCDEPGCMQKFLRMGLLVRHQMSHMNEKPYKCDMCTKSFATLNQLRCHKKLHEGRQFECDICFKRFTTKGVMQQHRAIHFDNKPYLCDTCGFSTKHLSHLVSHRKIHTGDVLRCSFPNCSYSTPKQGHMTQHINTHLNIRNHICQVCGKSFVVRGKLLRHERIHLKEKLYKCKQCDYQTSRTDRMKLHIESHGIKFKKKKFNLPIVEETEKTDIDFHQLYEKVQTTEGGQIPGLTGLSLVSMADMKPLDAISLAASASMIVDSYTAPRHIMDQLSAETVATMDDSLAFQQGYERIHAATFDQL